MGWHSCVGYRYTLARLEERLMETKRCAQCHKLLRAETQTCSRCGYTFPETKRRRQTKSLPRPSLPPASPHRAGHYSGLHPEDQPYQSNMIAAQHAPLREPEEIPSYVETLSEKSEPRYDSLFDEDEDDIPTTITAHQEKPQTEASATWRIEPAPILRTRQVPSTTPVPPVYTQPTQREKRPTDTESTLVALRPLPPRREKPARARYWIPFFLTLSCIFFLLASGILVYALTASKAVPSLSMSANPDTVRVGDTVALNGKGLAPATQIQFTHDSDVPINDSTKHQLKATTDHQGMFSVDILVPSDWTPGPHAIHATDEAQASSATSMITVLPPSMAPPQLLLPVTQIDLGSDRAGTTSSKQITLKNAGGGELAWQSSSDATWLTASPISNSYVFSGSSPITITANRSKLTPRTYTGHITFKQKDSENTVKLLVMMKVDSSPAALDISTSVLTFSTTTTQSVPNQSVTLQNSGGKALDWQATANTSNSVNWLYIVGSSSGHIDARQSQQLGVGVQAQQLAVGTYQGAITLTGGASATISVSLTVVAPGNILVSPLALSFTALTGQPTASKTLTVQNSGGQSSNWSVSVPSNASWLSVAPTSGTVAAGESATLTVNVNALNAGTYQTTILFTSGSQTTPIPVSLTVTTPPAAVISAQPTGLTFQAEQGIDPVGQFLTLTNTGNASLNWVASESGNGATFAPLSLYSGSLVPQAHVDIEVNPSISTYKAGPPLSTTITFADSDPGTTVASQKVPITITIQSQAEISASPSQFSLDTSSQGSNTQVVTITNTGTAPLNWTASIHVDEPASGTWLSMSTTSGKLAPSASTTVTITASSTGLQKGEYYGGNIQISSSDMSTTVSPQTVYVSFYP